MILSPSFRAVTSAAILAAAITSAVMAQSATAQDSTLVARVGDQTITAGDVAQAEADFRQDLAQVPAERRRLVLIDVLVDMALLAQAAEAAGLDKEPAFQRRLDFLRIRALRNIYVEKKIAGSITPAEIKAEYDRQSAAFQPLEEISARHILLASRQEAEAVIAELDAGKDFAELAREKSTGPSGPDGGDLGRFGRGRMMPEFEAAAFDLEAGAYSSEPVKTQFGWHVIKVEEKSMTRLPPLAQMEDQVRNGLVRQKFETVMNRLRAQTPIEIIGAAVQENAPVEENGKADNKN
ncbi:MAG: peptidylprolyl isomerase [Alphaproteobacteria bacterium]|nr:MAG: peptidylprolyl isomerase [Alphaproteobacteria bacterium]